MSDVSQGPGWWQASDGKWYRPEQHPDYRPPPPPPSPPPPPFAAPPPPPNYAYGVMAPQAASHTSTVPAGAWLSILGGAVAIVCSLLPWISATSGFGGGVTRNAFQLGAGSGFSVDGIILMGLGSIAVVIGIVRLTNSAMPQYLQRSPIVLALGVGIVAGNRIPSINNLVHHVESLCSGACTASIGYGAYIAFVAAGLMLIGGFVLRPPSDKSIPFWRRPM